MTMTLPTGDSPTLEAVFKNCVTHEQVEAAAINQLRGPFHVGELTVFVFRPLKDNGEPMKLAVLPDTGLGGLTEAGRQEVDLNQLSCDELAARAQGWYKIQIQRGAFNIDQVAAVAYDSSRTSAPELDGEAAQKALKATLDTLSKPGWTERAVAAVKQAFAPSNT